MLFTTFTAINGCTGTWSWTTSWWGARTKSCSPTLDSPVRIATHFSNFSSELSSTCRPSFSETSTMTVGSMSGPLASWLRFYLQAGFPMTATPIASSSRKLSCVVPKSIGDSSTRPPRILSKAAWTKMYTSEPTRVPSYSPISFCALIVWTTGPSQMIGRPSKTWSSLRN